MGATNRPDILDPALLRPGRFDRQIVVDVPDVHGRLEILRLHGGKRPLAPDASLEEVARQTPGFSGAELANVINEAALLSVRDGRGEIDQATLEEAIDRVVAGPAKRHILTERGALADRDPRVLARGRDRRAGARRPPRASSRSSRAAASSAPPRTCSPTATR